MGVRSGVFRLADLGARGGKPPPVGGRPPWQGLHGWGLPGLGHVRPDGGPGGGGRYQAGGGSAGRGVRARPRRPPAPHRLRRLHSWARTVPGVGGVMATGAKVVQALLFVLFMFFAQVATPASPEVEKRIAELLGRMTPEEKLGQISQSTSMQTPLSE